MDVPKPQQHIDQVKNSAVSNAGTANNYNIQGDQHLHYPVSQKNWKPPVMLPPRAQSFVGRDEDLTWLLQQLASEGGVILALCGPGGIGKTALAAEALIRLTAREDWLVRFPGGIFYHSFYSSPSVDVAFEELARCFEEDLRPDPRHAALRALSRQRTLLVFDGVEVLPDALPLCNLGGTHIVLMLSRRQSDAPDREHRRPIDLLSLQQGITLLQQLAGSRATDLQSVERLVQSIKGYPLALQIIGSYLSSRQEEVADYLRWFEREGLAALDHGKHQAQSVRVLLGRTYDSLTHDEQDLFVLLGLLAPAPFPLELVQHVLDLPENSIRQAINTLIDLSVLQRPAQSYEVSHPLVHTFAKEQLLSQIKATSSPPPNTIMTWRERFLAPFRPTRRNKQPDSSPLSERFLTTLVTHFDQSDPYDAIGLALWHPHVLSLLTVKDLTFQQVFRAASLFDQAGFAAYTQGKYAEAEPLLQRALAIREQQLGASHPSTATSLNNLALLYKTQGKYAKAEPLYQRALAIREQQLGASHPDTATSLNNLAALYQEQGKYAKAELLYQRALAICEQELGASHPDTATSLNNLALLYQEQSKYAKAEPLLRRALVILKQVLGEPHQNTLSVQKNYDSLLQAIGRDAKMIPHTQASPPSTHQQEVMRKKAKEKMSKQSRKNNRNR